MEKLLIWVRTTNWWQEKVHLKILSNIKLCFHKEIVLSGSKFLQFSHFHLTLSLSIFVHFFYCTCYCLYYRCIMLRILFFSTVHTRPIINSKQKLVVSKEIEKICVTSHIESKKSQFTCIIMFYAKICLNFWKFWVS